MIILHLTDKWMLQFLTVTQYIGYRPKFLSQSSEMSSMCFYYNITNSATKSYKTGTLRSIL